jgi:hypothetical protein
VLVTFKVGDGVRIVKYGNSVFDEYPSNREADIFYTPNETSPYYVVRITPEESGLPEDDFWPCSEDELELL